MTYSTPDGTGSIWLPPPGRPPRGNKPTPDFRFGSSEAAFGTPGAGGGFAFADPERGVGSLASPTRRAHDSLPRAREMTPGGLLFLVLSASSVGTTQVPPRPPPAAADDLVAKLRGRYGEPEPASVHEIVSHPQFYQQRMVRTRGLFEPGPDRGEYRLREEHDQLLLLAVAPGGEVELLMGRSVDVVGVVRWIRPKEYVNRKDLDKIEDPDLPVLPAPDPLLPRVSLSFISMFDATPSAHLPGAGGLADVVRDAGSRGRSVKVVGQFRGANLFGDLPDLPGRDADAFVLKDGETAIWVVGKAAAGKGFRLDPRLQGDSRFWLEIEGRLEQCTGQTCLRARRIQLTVRPASSEP